MPTLAPVLWQRLIRFYGGEVKLWIDQSEKLSDPLADIRNLRIDTKLGLIQSLQEVLLSGRPSASAGQCMAIAYDWIRNGIQIGNDFAEDFRGANSLHYKILQMRHRLDVFAQKQSYSYLRLRRKLLKIAKGVEALSHSPQSKLSVISLEAQIDTSEQEFERLRLKIYQPSFAEHDGVHIWGITEKMMFASADDICQILANGELQGWFLLALEGGILESDGGHAIGLRFWDSKSHCQLLDANTGLFDFSRREDLLKFFTEVLWENIYTFLYSVGRFRLVRYSLYPNLNL